MQETIFVKTCSLHEGNLITLAEEIRKWIPHASVYTQMTPRRIIVCKCALATVINEGDVFSLIQRQKEILGTFHDIVNHSEKQGTVRISIDGFELLIETFVSRTVGDTENMKFRLTCLSEPELSRDFDDYASLSNELGAYIESTIDKRLMTL